MSLREQKKQITRQKLIQIADREFRGKEFTEVMVDDIAAEAGISQKTFFNYFASKAHLLEEVLLSWLRKVNVDFQDAKLEATVESAIYPPNRQEIQNWVVEHRRILQMILQYTNLFDSIYYSEDGMGTGNLLFPPEYRKPRRERVVRAQQMGVCRTDLDPDYICDMYDYIRLDFVRRWLCLPEDKATAQAYTEASDQAMDVFFRGLSPENGK